MSTILCNFLGDPPVPSELVVGFVGLLRAASSATAEVLHDAFSLANHDSVIDHDRAPIMTGGLFP